MVAGGKNLLSIPGVGAAVGPVKSTISTVMVLETVVSFRVAVAVDTGRLTLREVTTAGAGRLTPRGVVAVEAS